MCPRVRRRQTIPSSVCRFRNRGPRSTNVGAMMKFRKVNVCASSVSRRKATKLPKSSRRFCIGVPVRHQRRWAESSWIALNSLVFRFRILWAAKTSLVKRDMYREHKIYLHPKQRGTNEPLTRAKVFAWCPRGLWHM